MNPIPDHVKESLHKMAETAETPIYKERAKLWQLQKELVLTALKHRSLKPVI